MTRIEPHGESGFVEANGLRLHYLGYGEGPPIALVPGITSPAISWEFVARELADEFHVLVLDVRGRGLSDRGPSYASGDYADDLIALTHGLGLDRPILVGHSMGGRIVAAAAARKRDAFGGVVVVDPPLSGLGRDPYPFPLDVYVNALREAQAGATADDMRSFYPTWPDRELQIRADWLATCDERAVVETYCNFHLEDFFDDWPKVTAPALFVYGGESPVVPAAALAEIATTNPAAELACVKRAGHMIPFENLVDFVDAVRDFAAG